MMITRPLPLVFAVLLAACNSDDIDSSTNNRDAAAGDAAGRDATGRDATGRDATGRDGGVVSEECQKAANVARVNELVNAQPVIEGKVKESITATISFASLADDPETLCSLDLHFKDLNDNDSLEPYEDWTRPAEERALDLVSRMSDAEKMGLMVHATVSDVPSSSNSSPSAELEAMITGQYIRFALSTGHTGSLTARATWANNVQELCEATDLGIPFVLSMEPAHSSGDGRVKAAAFSKWPHELGLSATNEETIVETFGRVVGMEYRAVGVSMALSPSADLATDPRWYQGQFTFGENSERVSRMVRAYIRGLQGETFGPESVAAVVKYFPGAGAAQGGWDARLEKGKYLTYPGDNIDAHLETFAAAIDAGVAGVITAYGIPESGNWSGLDGLIDGNTIEQVGASFHDTLLTDVLRGHYEFSGLVLAPWGVIEDAGLSPLGAPWGVEEMSGAQRVAKAVTAGVDQFGGLNDPTPIAEAETAGLITNAQVDAAAARALAVIFALGLFEDPYVEPSDALRNVNSDDSYRSGLNAMNRSMVLLVNEDKPAGWLNGDGDGTQTADKGNAGNGTLKVLPAPPGEPYVSPGCSYYIMGNFDLDYVRSVSTGYGELTNDTTSIDGVPVTTDAEKIARSDYVFLRIDAPYSVDPDSGDLALSRRSLEYAGNDNASVLDDLAAARAAIDNLPSSTAQIIVGIDAGRASVVSEVLSFRVSGLYLEWSVTDKVFLDVAFGIVDGSGTLPVGLPASDAAADQQDEDLPGDGQTKTFVEGYGLFTEVF